MAEKRVNTTEEGYRPPIVTFLGHVDHGKTSILDAIRHTSVQKGEYGGITQHIGAYQIDHKGNLITFIDTPGHAAFTQMRARGGKAADIVVLVVAADDGVQPQTKEAIQHAKAANAAMIVAINKMDKAGADADKVKQELARENVMVEDWGGDIISVETSATKDEGLEDLLDSIIVLSEVLELKASPDDELEATIIESKKDKSKGVVVNAVVRNGSLKMGQEITASGYEGKVKSLVGDTGKVLTTAGPSVPVEILGFKVNPRVGDLIVEKGSDLEELAVDEDRVEIVGQETKKTIGIIIRGDTQGTLQAVKGSLAKLVTENVNADYSLKFLLEGTGFPTESDVLLASSANGLIVCFNVQIPSSVRDFAESRGVPVKTYQTIYDLIDEVKDVLEGAAFREEAEIKGRAKILKTFKLQSGDVIAGCEILAGKLNKGDRIAVYNENPADVEENDEPVYRGSIKKLKDNKDDVKTIRKGNECGILFKPQFDDIEKGQYIEVI